MEVGSHQVSTNVLGTPVPVLLGQSTAVTETWRCLHI